MVHTRSMLLRCAVIAAIGLGTVGCGSSSSTSPNDPAIRALQREARPIGRGVRFHEPVRGQIPGPCRPRLGPRIRAHVELFAADKVVLIPAGIGVRGSIAHLDGRIASARCYGDLVTLDPTGVVLIKPGPRLTLQTLFAAWGQPLTRTQLAPFSAAAGQLVRVYTNGSRRRLPPWRVPLANHAEIVLELGPYVEPHRRFNFVDAP